MSSRGVCCHFTRPSGFLQQNGAANERIVHVRERERESERAIDRASEQRERERERERARERWRIRSHRENVFSNVDAKSFAASPTVEEPAAMRLYWLIVLFLLATVVAGAKVTHRVHVLRPGACSRSARARRGDDMVLSLAAFGVEPHGASVSDGLAEQRHVVGKHPIVPLNNALVGMCEGERRKLSVFWDGMKLKTM